MKNVFVSSHPLVADCLSVLRDKTSSTKDFRISATQITKLLLSEASYGLHLSEKTIHTPLTKMNTRILSTEIVVIAILRAGLAMLHEAITLFPSTKVGLAGLRRDEKTAVAKEYYWNVPDTKGKTVFILDPMLATGGSALCVLRKIKQAKEIRLVTIISAPEGVTSIHSAFPSVRIYTGAVDQKLNARKFILPGLGDFGDLYFGT